MLGGLAPRVHLSIEQQDIINQKGDTDFVVILGSFVVSTLRLSGPNKNCPAILSYVGDLVI